jgi:hypothetical protein
MAIQATAQWWIRADGSNNNGGGYDASITGAGTNYAQDADAVLISGGLSTPGAGSTTLNNAAGFTSAMVGNAIKISSGTNFTPGYYFITGFTSATAVTLDRTPTPSGAGSIGLGFVGGAFANFVNVASSTASPAVPVVAGNTVNIRGSGLDNPSSPDYSVTGYYDTWTAGTVAAGRVAYIGYNGRPFIRGNGLLIYNATRSHWQHLKFSQTGTAADTAVMAQSSYSTIDDVYWDQNGQDFGFCYGTADIRNSWFFNTGSTAGGSVAAVRPGNYAGLVHGCTFQDLRYRAVQGNTSVTLVRCIIDSCHGDYGVTVADAGAPAFFIEGNVFYNNTGTGLYLTDGNILGRGGSVTNNIFYGNGGYGISVGDGTTALNDRLMRLSPLNNAFRNNTSGNYNALTGSNDIALGADPFIDAANGNFGLNGVANGGALLQGAGFPSVFPGISTQAYFDIGAVQRESPSDDDIAEAVWTYAQRSLTS